MTVALFGPLASRVSSPGLSRAQIAADILGAVHGGTLELLVGSTVVGTAVVTGFVNPNDEVVSNSTSMVLTASVAPGDAGLKIRYTSPSANEGFSADVDGVIVKLANAVASGSTISIKPLTWGIGVGSTLPSSFPPAVLPGTAKNVLLDSQTDAPRPVGNPIGMHFHAWPLPGQLASNGYQTVVTPGPTYPFHIFRNHNNSASGFLADLFPTPQSAGEFDNLILVFAAHKAAGRKNLFCNFCMPSWLSELGNYFWSAYPSYPGGAGSPNDWDAYRERISRIVTACNKGANAGNPLIDYFEAWNEPDLQFIATAEAGYGPTFWSGPNTYNDGDSIAARRTALARLQKETYLGVKAIDPNLPVFGPGFVWWNEGDPNRYLDWMRTPTGTGGVAGDYMDGLSSHHYDSEAGTNVSQFIARMKELRYVRDAYGGNLPMIMTESGVLHGSYKTPTTHAARIRKLLRATLGLDLIASILYSADGSLSSGSGVSKGYDLIGQPSFEPVVSAALADAYAEMNGKTVIDVVELTDGRIYARYSDLTEVVS